jgi:arginine exporter protein ArgO
VRALVEGILAGLGIAVPVGPIAVLLIDLGIRRGFGAALPAGLGAASADLTYATVAAVLGAAAADALEPVVDLLRIASVLVLVAIAAIRIRELLRAQHGEPARATTPRTGLRLYLAYLGLTLLNPVTVAYFGALILGLQATTLLGPTEKILFVTGAVAASAAWQTVLVGMGSVLHHRLPERARLLTGLVGAVVILGLAVRLAVA